MALVGNLKDLKLVNIIQINCIERNTAKLSIRELDKVGSIYFSEGNIVHGELGPYVGEQAIYEMLALNEGQFKVEAGIEPPTQTINQPWSSVVMEGLRLLDEKELAESPVPKQLLTILSDLKTVKNVYVLDLNGRIVEGKSSENYHPLFLTFIWYKHKKMLNHLYSQSFRFIQLRDSGSFYFIFEGKPNLIVLETNLKVYVPDFSRVVQENLDRYSF
jgi:hypothetical protein